MAKIKAKDQTWLDMNLFAKWALDNGFNDDRITALCELFLAIKEKVDADDKAAKNGDIH